MHSPLNPQANQIRLSKNYKRKFKMRDQELVQKVYKDIPKYSESYMVAAGLSAHGPGKLIFVAGTMDSKVYLQTLDFYKEDIERLNPQLELLQDNAPCHTSIIVKDYIEKLDGLKRMDNS